MPKIIQFLTPDGIILPSSDNKLLQPLDFVSTPAGQTKQIDLVIENLLPNQIELMPYTENPEMKILLEKNIIPAFQATRMTISFSPDPQRVEPLTAENSIWGFDIRVG